MQNFQLLTRGTDVLPLLLSIKRQPGLWKEDTYLRDYPQGPFGEIESIMLRFQDRSGLAQKAAIECGQYDQHESIDYPAYALLPDARPMVMSLMHYVGGERLGRVLINKIAPGGRIYPHEDSKAHTDYYSRFHIVLQSEPGCLFRAGDEQVHMQTGEVWWFNNAANHEVINNSCEDRIHMIVDIRCSRGA